MRAGELAEEPAKKALATLDRDWDGLIAHRAARLGTATPVWLDPPTRSSDVTVTNTVMLPVSMPAHTTFEYLLLNDPGRKDQAE